MFNYIAGKLVEADPTFAVIDCHGFGFLIEISLNTYSAIKDMDEVKLLVHEIIREDAFILFGFHTEGERKMFRLLLDVNGVGAATARIMLSSFTVEELSRAILDQDVKRVQKVKGIGAKTAQRILLELRDKVNQFAVTDDGNFATASPTNNKNAEEALSALVMLGFPKAASEKVLAKISGTNPGASAEDFIKLALAHGI